MSEKPISPLGTRMIEDLTVRNLVLDTQRGDIRSVKKLVACLKRSPDTATAEDLQAFSSSPLGDGTRHSFVTHLLEQNIVSPLDRLSTLKKPPKDEPRNSGRPFREAHRFAAQEALVIVSEEDLMSFEIGAKIEVQHHKAV